MMKIKKSNKSSTVLLKKTQVHGCSFHDNTQKFHHFATFFYLQECLRTRKNKIIDTPVKK